MSSAMEEKKVLEKKNPVTVAEEAKTEATSMKEDSKTTTTTGSSSSTKASTTVGGESSGGGGDSGTGAPPSIEERPNHPKTVEGEKDISNKKSSNSSSNNNSNSNNKRPNNDDASGEKESESNAPVKKRAKSGTTTSTSNSSSSSSKKSSLSTTAATKKKKSPLECYPHVPMDLDTYEAPIKLPLILKRIEQLINAVPTIQETAQLRPERTEALTTWCRRINGIIRNYHLVCNFITPATYQWGPDRTGHAQQNLQALNEESSDAGNILSNVIHDHIIPILRPTRTTQLVRKTVVVYNNNNNNNETGTTTKQDETKKEETKKEEEKESGDKSNQGTKKTVETFEYEEVVDQTTLKYRKEMLCLEALDKRELLIAMMKNFSKSLQDYLKANEGDDRAPMMSY